MTLHDCAICLGSMSNYVKCGNPLCLTYTCFECGEALLKFSRKNGVMPECPGTTCRQHYLYSEIKKLSRECMAMYTNACFEYFMHGNKTKIDETLNHEAIIEKVRQDRNKFIKLEFPAAVAMTIEFALASKLRRITVKNRKHAQTILLKLNKKCMNLFCPGKLDNDTNVCTTCDTKFCKDCECIVKNNHSCRKEDIESVKFVQTLIRCPNKDCALPVIRSYGCNFITCSVCKTKFDYTTGLPSDQGNHQNDTTIINNSMKPSERYGMDYPLEIIEMLCDLEAKLPNKVTIAFIIKILTDVVKLKTGDTCQVRKSDIAKHYEKYVVTQHMMKQYYKALAVVEDHHINNTLNTQVLKTLIISFE